MSDLNKQIDVDAFKGHIWSLSLKYLDYMNHCTEEGEEYYLYRDDKAKELSDEVVKKLLELTGGKDE